MNNKQSLLPRYLTSQVGWALTTFPVVVLTGARQTGKSTLIRELLPGSSRVYRTLDDIDVLERAEHEPEALVSVRHPLAIDEIQRSPDLLLAIKRAVDRDRRPGRFLLSGSANLALAGRVSETLAGRAIYLTLHPFTAAERAGYGRTGPWESLLTDPSQLEGQHPAFRDVWSRLLSGGFPVPALDPDPASRRAWLDGYVRTYLERDLQTLSAIDNLVDFRRLMRIAALRSAALINQSEMARDAGLSQPTAHRYLNLLEASYLLHRLPAYAVNKTKGLVKSPKLYLCDTGLASYLAGADTEESLASTALGGALLETMVLGDLLAWREAATARPEVLYWRTTTGAEVDFILERRGRVVPLEVKTSSRPRRADVQHLALFLEEYGKAAPHGVLLHTGERAELLADRLWGIPLSAALGISGAPHGPHAA